VSAKHPLPAQARAAACAGRTSSSRARSRACGARSGQLPARAGLSCSSRSGAMPFARRKRPTASGAPRNRLRPDTCRTPSRRQENCRHDRFRVYSGHAQRPPSPAAESAADHRARSGPGGQHAQKSETRVEAVFDVEASSALTDRRSRRCCSQRPARCCRRDRQDEPQPAAKQGSSRRSDSLPRCRHFRVERGECRRSRPPRPARRSTREAPAT